MKNIILLLIIIFDYFNSINLLSFIVDLLSIHKIKISKMVFLSSGTPEVSERDQPNGSQKRSYVLQHNV